MNYKRRPPALFKNLSKNLTLVAAVSFAAVTSGGVPTDARAESVDKSEFSKLYQVERSRVVEHVKDQLGLLNSQQDRSPKNILARAQLLYFLGQYSPNEEEQLNS